MRLSVSADGSYVVFVMKRSFCFLFFASCKEVFCR